MDVIEPTVVAAAAVGVATVSAWALKRWLELPTPAAGPAVGLRHERRLAWYEAQRAWWRSCKWVDELAVRVTPQELERIERVNTRLAVLRRGPLISSSAPESSEHSSSSSSEHSRSSVGLDDLPNEVLHLILAQLSTCDLAALRLVCKRFRDVEMDPYLWYQRAVAHFGPANVAAVIGQAPEPAALNWRFVYALNQLAMAAGGTVRRVALATVVQPAEPEAHAEAHAEAGNSRRRSQFGGVASGSTPDCGDCGRRLTLVLQLAWDELPAQVAERFAVAPRGSGALLQLFICAWDSDNGSGPCSCAEPHSGGCVVRWLLGDDTGGDTGGDTGDEHDEGETEPRVFPRQTIIGFEGFLEDIGEYWHGGGAFEAQTPYYDYFTSAAPLSQAEKKLVFPSLPLSSRHAILRKRHPMEHARINMGLDPQTERELAAADQADLESMRPGEALIKAVSQCDKIGGFAALPPCALLPRCRVCDSPMLNMIAQVSSVHHVPWMFGACGIGQIVQCPVHLGELTFSWSDDV